MNEVQKKLQKIEEQARSDFRDLARSEQQTSDRTTMVPNKPKPLGKDFFEDIHSELGRLYEKDQSEREDADQSSVELFDKWDSAPIGPNEYRVEVYPDSLEARVGYASLIREMQTAHYDMIAYLASSQGVAIPEEEARNRVYHRATDVKGAKEIFVRIMRYSFEEISYNDLYELYFRAPRVGERLWERIKAEARSEFESGHLASGAIYPVNYMRNPWRVGLYLGVRESFIAEWQPRGGIELSLIDMMAQAFLQWQYWMEQTVKRSKTEPRREHYDYENWKRGQSKLKDTKSWEDGYWFPPYVHEQKAIEHAVQMADRSNRIYMRSLRQLRDLRRYSSVTIGRVSQLNFAAPDAQQLNISESEIQ